MTLDIREIVSAIKEDRDFRDRYRKIYDRYLCGQDSERVIQKLFSSAMNDKDCLLMSVSNILYGYYMEEEQRKKIAFSKKYISQFWCASHQDAVGYFQGFGTPEDIEFLKKIAIESLPSWDERNDEMQQFFRKCAHAIAAIANRDLHSERGVQALLDMARVEPKIAAYWAKKEVNKLKGANSPFISEDLSEPPEVDYEWPSNEEPSIR